VASAYISAASFAEAVNGQRELLEVRLLFERDAEARFAVGVVAKMALAAAHLSEADATRTASEERARDEIRRARLDLRSAELGAITEGLKVRLAQLTLSKALGVGRP
jgi:hypothetical protein